MFIWDWFNDILSRFGLRNKNATILFIGLDNAGKTTLLNILKNDRLAQFSPTSQPCGAELIIGKIRVRAFDMGGHRMVRRLWKDYGGTADALVFMVDAADRSRFPEAKAELETICNDVSIRNIPIVIFGNKIDKQSAASEEELRNQLGLHIHQSAGRQMDIFMVSVSKKMGYDKGFQWLSSNLP